MGSASRVRSSGHSLAVHGSSAAHGPLVLAAGAGSAGAGLHASGLHASDADASGPDTSAPHWACSQPVFSHASPGPPGSSTERESSAGSGSAGVQASGAAQVSARVSWSASGSSDAGVQSSVPSQKAGGASDPEPGGAGGCHGVGSQTSGSVGRALNGGVDGSAQSHVSEPWRWATSIGGASAAFHAAAVSTSTGSGVTVSPSAPSVSKPLVALTGSGTPSTSSTVDSGVGGVASMSGRGAPGSPSGTGSGSRASSSKTSTLLAVAGSSGGSRNAGGMVCNAGISGASATAASRARGLVMLWTGGRMISRRRVASSGETCIPVWRRCSRATGSRPRASAMAASSRSFTGIRLPGGSSRSLVRVLRYGARPASSWVRRSWAMVSPIVVVLGSASSPGEVRGISSATSTPHEPASTQRSLSGIGTLPRSYATSSRRLNPAPRATSDSERPFLRRTSRRCVPSCFGVTVS